MIDEGDAGPVETATGYSDRFLEAGVAKLDALFGDGYARGNPQALAAYLAACASNLNAFMTAAAALSDEALFDEAALFEMETEEEIALAPPPPRKPKGRR